MDKRFPFLFVSISAALLSLAVVLYLRDQNTQRQMHQMEGKHAAALHAQILAAEFHSVKSDLLFLAGQSALEKFLDFPGSRQERALSQEYELFSRQKGIYDQIRFIDETGREAVRINYNGGRPASVARKDLQNKTGRYYLREAALLEPGEIYVSPFDLNVEHGRIERPFKPTLRFATPVFDPQGRRRGIVVLNFLGEYLLSKLDKTSSNLPGRLMLLNGDGFWLNGPSEGKKWGFMFGREKTFARTRPAVWREALRAQQGTTVGIEGLHVFHLFDPATDGIKTNGRTESLLRVIYNVPPQTLYAKSRKLLRTLLVLCAVALLPLAVLIWMLARADAARRENERKLRESESRLRTLSRGLLTAQELERERLSRDLHDDLGQLLTAACLELERSLSYGKTDRSDLQRALENTQNALDRMRAISARLRPRVLNDMGLREAVETLAEECREKTRIDIRTHWDVRRAQLAPKVSENLYRIIQEALTNAAKHSRTKKCLIRLRLLDDRVELSVRDWGNGLSQSPPRPDALGLIGIKERAHLLGGTCRIDSRPGKGTELRIIIPTAPVSLETQEKAHAA